MKLNLKTYKSLNIKIVFIKVMNLKEQIFNFVKSQGPVLPVQISQKFSSNTIFAGAILSELVSNKLIKISYAKIGGSPLYYVQGQEDKLSKLYDYLPSKEKEAYNLLKEKKVLEDQKCEPGIRVALRNLRDFAFPFKINEKIFWRWYLVSLEEVNGLLLKQKEISLRKEVDKEKKVVRKKAIKKENELLNEVKLYLSNKKIELIDLKNIKKNEINLVIKFKSDLGDLNYFLYCKNKKRISDSDLRLAYSKGQQNKLPVLFLSKGELNKKAQKYLSDMKGYLIFRKL